MKTYVYVDVVTMHDNRTRNAVQPPIVVTGGGNLEPVRAGCRVRILGPCEIVYDKGGVVFAGAAPHVAVVTEAPVEIVEEYGQ